MTGGHRDQETGRRLIATTRQARYDYTILKTDEAGIVLVGNELRSLRVGHAYDSCRRTGPVTLSCPMRIASAASPGGLQAAALADMSSSLSIVRLAATASS